jgi:hypothetical protein
MLLIASFWSGTCYAAALLFRRVRGWTFWYGCWRHTAATW